MSGGTISTVRAETRAAFVLAVLSVLVLLPFEFGYGENRYLGAALHFLESGEYGMGRYAATSGDTVRGRGRVLPHDPPAAFLLGLPGAVAGRAAAALVGDEALPRESRSHFADRVRIPVSPADADLPLGVLLVAGVVTALFLHGPILGAIAAIVAAAAARAATSSLDAKGGGDSAAIASTARRIAVIAVVFAAPLLLWARLPTTVIPGVALSVVAAALVLGDRPRPFTAGLLAAFAGCVHYFQLPTFGLLGLAVLVWLGMGAASRFALGAAGPLLLMGAFHVWLTGSPFKSASSLFFHEGGWPIESPVLVLIELLIGPRRGLFLVAPIFLLLPSAIKARLREGSRFTRIETFGLWNLAFHLALVSVLYGADPPIWHAGAGTASRYLYPALPLALISIAAFAAFQPTAPCAVPITAAVGLWFAAYGPFALSDGPDSNFLHAINLPFVHLRALPATFSLPYVSPRLLGLGAAAFLGLGASGLVFLRHGPGRAFLRVAAVTAGLALLHHGLVLDWMRQYERIDDPARPVVLHAGEWVAIETPYVRPAREIVVYSAMAHASRIPQGATVATISIECDSGVSRRPIRAGIETAEWSLGPPGGALRKHFGALESTEVFAPKNGATALARFPVPDGCRFRRILFAAGDSLSGPAAEPQPYLHIYLALAGR